MTPAQLEHLKLIDAHLERLLAIAEKRTPGEWRHNEGRRMQLSAITMHQDPVLFGDHYELAGVDGDFIASCAGNAEAGWKTTRAAIKSLLEIEKFLGSTSDNDFTARTAALIQDALLPRILATFPLKSLKL